MQVQVSPQIALEVEQHGDPERPAIVLIMGLGMQLVAWPDALVDALVARGFRVVRFDNRDAGLSTQIDAFRPRNLPTAMLRGAVGWPVDAPYRLSELAADTVCLLDALGIARAHVVGASMGGLFGLIAESRWPGLFRAMVLVDITPRWEPAGLQRILAFMLFYRFGEAMLGSLVPLFLQDTLDTSKGPDPTRGLGFDVNAVGLVNGTFGVFGIILGGILGGWYVSKVGVRKAFWALAAAMNLPNLLYYWASQARPGVDVMSGILFFDQMGYGLGFAGYIVCLMQIASRVPQFRTAHYAIGTGLGATFISLAGILSGELMKNFDFPTIFLIVFCFTIPCLITILLVPLDETQGRGTDLRNLDTQD